MQINIPIDLKNDSVLKTIDNLSYARYVQCQFQTKNEVQIESSILIYVLKGTKIIHFDADEETISSGDILFLRSGNYVMSEVLDESYEALLFFYTDDLLNDFVHKYEVELHPYDTLKQHEIFRVESTAQLIKGILSIVPYFEDDVVEEKHLVKLKLEELFLNILSSNSSDIFKDLLSSIYNSDTAFKHKIEKECINVESVREMLMLFKMNEVNFRNKFKQLFGMPPKQWLLSKKLERARLLLERSDKNVTEVCTAVGFNSISWFIQSFKNEFGVTPKQLKTDKK